MSNIDKLMDQIFRDAIGMNLYIDRFSNIQSTTYPPHNIAKISDTEFVIEMALSGFTEKDVSIVVESGVLKVTGSKDLDYTKNYIHKGIAFRDFEKQFVLNEYVEVTNAEFNNGLLVINLKQVLPESKKPKVISINTTKTTSLLK